MRQKRKILPITLYILCLLLTLCGCKTEYEGKVFYSTRHFSTYVEWGMYDYFDEINTAKGQKVWESVEQLLTDAENCLSVTKNGDIARYNALTTGESIKISDLTAQVIRIARQAYELTDGAYNPAVYLLCDLWGFSPRITAIESEEAYRARTDVMPYDRASLSDYDAVTPDEKYVEAFTKLCDFEQNILSGDQNNGYYLTKHCEGVTVEGVTYYQHIDLGGVAKGFAVDKVREILADNGYRHGYFSCGQSSILALKRPVIDAFDNVIDEEYNIEPASPRSNGNYCALKYSDTVITSSGDYQTGKYRIIGGKRYCHVFDPKTGLSVNTQEGKGIATVTLISGNAALSDALSTALMVMGENALDWLNTHAKDLGIEYVMVFFDENTLDAVTNVASERFRLIDGQVSARYSIDSDGTVTYTGTVFD